MTVTPYDAWSSGLPLERALERWGGGTAWAREHSRLLADFDLLRMEHRSPLVDRPAAVVRLQSMGGAWDDHLRCYAALREAFRERLWRGELFAIGFARAGRGAQRLTAVPPAAWSAVARIDWARSRVKADGHRFLDVRIVRPDAAQLDRAALQRIGAGSSGRGGLE